MCQQAIEKLVKGLYVIYVDEKVQKVHNIGLLINRFEDALSAPISEDHYLLSEIERDNPFVNEILETGVDI